MNKKILKVETRKLFKRKVKSLRRQGLIPANIFGKGVKSRGVQVKESDFLPVFKEVGETGLVYLDIAGAKKGSEEKAVLVSNLQKDPISDKTIHVDFRQVSLKEKVTAEVAIEAQGESPAEKTGLGTVVQQISEIEVEALPQDLPEKFVIDISKLTEVDQAIYVKDLEYDSKRIDIKLGAETIIVKVEPPQKEEVIAPPVEAVPLEGEAKVAGEEAPAAEGAGEAGETKPQEESQAK